MLDLSKLRYLVTVARRRSFARAADELGLSQPALTRAVQSLEQQFGVRLLDRDRAGVAVTAAGQELVERAMVLLANANDLERQFGQVGLGSAGRVRFGIAPMPARALLSETLLALLAAAPEVAHEVMVRNIEALWAQLAAGEIEFFIGLEGQVPDSPSSRQEELGTFPLGRMVRRGHPLLNDASSGARFPVIVASRRGLPSAPDEPSWVGTSHVIEDFETLTRMGVNSEAVLVTSPFAVLAELASGDLTELPEPGPFRQRTAKMMVHSLERRTLSPAALSVIQALRATMRTLKDRYERCLRKRPGRAMGSPR